MGPALVALVPRCLSPSARPGEELSALTKNAGASITAGNSPQSLAVLKNPARWARFQPGAPGATVAGSRWRHYDRALK
jgi:hypothetical protein